MSINTLEVSIKCPSCGHVYVGHDYHENTSSDRCELFCVLHRKTFKCSNCTYESDAAQLYKSGNCSVEDKEYYKKSLYNTLVHYCSGIIDFISFSDWDFEITGRPSIIEQPALDHLCMMYPEDNDFQKLAYLYRCVRMYGKDYVNKFESGDRVITKEHIKMPECLRKVYLRNGVERIEERSFCCCSALWDIYLPDTVKFIGDEAFLKSGIKTIRTSSGLEKLGMRAFAECIHLVKFYIPENITHIEDLCFEGCIALKSMRIPDKTTVGDQIFKGCSGLEKVELPKHLQIYNIRDKLGLSERTEIMWYNAEE